MPGAVCFASIPHRPRCSIVLSTERDDYLRLILLRRDEYFQETTTAPARVLWKTRNEVSLRRLYLQRTLAGRNFNGIDQLPGPFGLAVLDGELLFVEPANLPPNRHHSLTNLHRQLAQSLMMALRKLRHDSQLEITIGIENSGRT